MAATTRVDHDLSQADRLLMPYLPRLVRHEQAIGLREVVLDPGRRRHSSIMLRKRQIAPCKSENL